MQAINYSCSQTTPGLPGWINCTGCVSLTVNKNVSSGYVSVYFDFPDAGSFFHGQLQMPNGKPGAIVVPVTNEYVSMCVTSVQTSIGVYDGPESNPSPPLLANLPTTIHSTC